MKRLTALLTLVALLLVAGCAGQRQEPAGNNAQSDLQKIMSRNTSPRELIDFANHNISSLTTAEATQLVLRLESTQRKQLDSRTNTLLENDKQTALQTLGFKGGIDDMINGTSDKNLKNLLQETKASGFKLIPLEGCYYPIIDYERYKIYQPYVTEDIKAYIDIAAAESEQTCTDDAALVISWSELAKRTLRAEAFVEKYPRSARIKDVREQYNLYISNYLYGANNTPAFDYETHTLGDDARQSYYETAQLPDNRLAGVIKQYLPILEKNKFKRTPEVEQFLKNAEKNLKSQ